MRIAPALLEDWLRDRYFSCEFDLSSSGVWTRSLGDLEKAGAADLARLGELELRDADSYGGGEVVKRRDLARPQRAHDARVPT